LIGVEQIALRLFLALLFSGLIGWERELHERPAGFRTHILVCLGATLIMIISLSIHEIYGDASDPGRIAAQVVSGIGFLGAGTIIREGISVKGLTTAASLWAVAGIGLGVGAGLYFGSFLTTLFVLVSLWFLSRVENKIISKNKYRELKFRVKDAPGVLGMLASVLGEENVNIVNVQLEHDVVDVELEIIMQVQLPSSLDRNQLTQNLAECKGVLGVEWMNS